MVKIGRKISTAVAVGLMVVLVISAVSCAEKKPKRLKLLSGRLSAIDTTAKNFTLKLIRREDRTQHNFLGIPPTSKDNELVQNYAIDLIVVTYNNDTKVMKGGSFVGIPGLKIDQVVDVEYFTQGNKKIASIVQIEY